MLAYNFKVWNHKIHKKHKSSLFPAQRSFAIQVKQGSASGGRAFGEPPFSSIIRGVRLPTVDVVAKVGAIRMLKVINQFIAALSLTLIALASKP
jgi:hypothetical protein